MLDSGAVLSLMDYEEFNRLQRDQRRLVHLKATNIQLRSFSGHLLLSVGRCQLSPCDLPPHEFIIVKKHAHSYYTW